MVTTTEDFFVLGVNKQIEVYKGLINNLTTIRQTYLTSSTIKGRVGNVPIAVAHDITPKKRRYTKASRAKMARAAKLRWKARKAEGATTL